jgi:hypothetical protein
MGRRRPIKDHWPACFYEPPQFAAVPGFNEMELDDDTSLTSAMIHPSKPEELTFFYGDKYATINISDRTKSNEGEPMDIARSHLRTILDRRWTSGVDAILPNPPKPGKYAFLFCGDKYITFTLTPEHPRGYSVFLWPMNGSADMIFFGQFSPVLGSNRAHGARVL